VKTIALIPARFGSSRFPGKPLAPILGKPLIRRVYEQTRQIPGLDAVYVATDDDRIRDYVAALGGRVVMTRSDHPSGSDRLAEATYLLDLAPEDLVINIQGDQALFPPEVIPQLAAVLSQDPLPAMATPARRVDDLELALNPNVVKVVFDQHNRALYFSRSPLPYWRDGNAPYFYKHLGIYAYRADFLRKFVTLPPGRWEEAEKLEQLRALEHGFPIHIVATGGDTLEVDTPEDLLRAEAYFREGD